jgi:hypothetical protein
MKVMKRLASLFAALSILLFLALPAPADPQTFIPCTVKFKDGRSEIGYVFDYFPDMAKSGDDLLKVEIFMYYYGPDRSSLDFYRGSFPASRNGGKSKTVLTASDIFFEPNRVKLEEVEALFLREHRGGAIYRTTPEALALLGNCEEITGCTVTKKILNKTSVEVFEVLSFAKPPIAQKELDELQSMLDSANIVLHLPGYNSEPEGISQERHLKEFANDMLFQAKLRRQLCSALQGEFADSRINDLLEVLRHQAATQADLYEAGARCVEKGDNSPLTDFAGKLYPGDKPVDMAEVEKLGVIDAWCRTKELTRNYLNSRPRGHLRLALTFYSIDNC